MNRYKVEWYLKVRPSCRVFPSLYGALRQFALWRRDANQYGGPVYLDEITGQGETRTLRTHEPECSRGFATS